MTDEVVPVGDNQIIERAIARATAALEADSDSDVGVGFSEGVIRTNEGYFLSAWCAVIPKGGKPQLGGGLHLALPEELRIKLKCGTLVESELEQLLESRFENPYKRLVTYALGEIAGHEK